jgi:hypothetical protein
MGSGICHPERLREGDRTCRQSCGRVAPGADRAGIRFHQCGQRKE